MVSQKLTSLIFVFSMVCSPSGECYPAHKSVFLLTEFGLFLLVLIGVCLAFFTLMDYVGLL